jgi:xanthine/uracil permease
MSRWLEQCGVWQFAVISWAFMAAVALAGTVTSAWLGFGGHLRLPGSLEPVVFGSVVLALGATCGRQMRQKAAAPRRPPSTRSE